MHGANLKIALTLMISSGYCTPKILIKHTRACSFFIYDTRKTEITASQTAFTYFVERPISWQDFVTTGI